MTIEKLFLVAMGVAALAACDGTTAGKGTASGETGTPSTGDDDDDDTVGVNVCEGDDCVCASGPCDVTCSGSGNCDTACNDADPCEVDCNGAGECDVQSTGGTVEVLCDGADCDVECSQADSCQVDCANGTCDVTCPTTGCEVTNCGAGCTVLCGFVPQIPSGGSVSCD